MAPDKIKHLQGGALAALGCGGVALALLAVGAHPLAAALVVSGLAAGGSIEGTQWIENRAGMPQRDVSLWDFLSTGAPAWAAAAAVQLWAGLS